MREIPVMQGSGVDPGDAVGVIRLSQIFEQRLLATLASGAEIKLTARIEKLGDNLKAISYHVDTP